jgi:hypothetical protein
MGEVIQLPGFGNLEFRRTVRALERFLREYLADGPKINGKVKFAGAHISTDKAHFDEARMNLGILHAVDPTTRRWYWALPGDETKIPNATKYHLAHRQPPKRERKDLGGELIWVPEMKTYIRAAS